MGALDVAVPASLSPGGPIALVSIVLLAVGIISMGTVYLASAVVVLDRFARVSQTRSARWMSAVLMAWAAAWLARQALRFEVSPAYADSWLASFVPVFLIALLGTGLAMAAVQWGLRTREAATLGSWVGRWAGLGAALAAVGAGRVSLPLGLALAPAVVFAVLRLRRPAGGSWVGVAQGFALRLTALFLLAAGLTLLPGSAVLVIGHVGGWLLGGLGFLVVLGLVPLAMAGLIDMRRSAEWFIARRYLVARRRQVFISAITGICVLGIAAGVWLIIVVLSVMNGFEQTWREEILGDRAHFVIERPDRSIEDWEAVLDQVRDSEGVVAASPYLEADVMVRGRAGEIHSVRLRGIDPVAIRDVNRLDEKILAGSLEALRGDGKRSFSRNESNETNPPVRPGILIGSQLAASLGLGVDDLLTVISPFGGPPTPLGPGPRLAHFQIVGLFRAGAYQYEEVYVYADIPVVQSFRRGGDVIDGIESLTTDYYRSRAVGATVVSGLGGDFRARDWKEYFPAFFQALKTERVMMAVLLTMIMVVAAFIIVATLVMMIMEKSSDIAILKAMGAEDAVVERIFALEGTMIGLLGTGLGVLAGLAVTYRLRWIQDRIEALTGVDALPASVYQLSTLPSRVDPIQVASVVAIAMVLSLGATLLPSWQGARIQPAEGLRHE
ncbi:MAG: FtsX-like permease family protein [Myxococcota bacterium]|nr:FtsX-like permease family protein [Myxococcota bacterium]